jgi:excisionase family DNA binding protein
VKTKNRSAGEPNLGSLGDAAEMCKVHKQTIRRYIAAGRLTGYRFGPRLLRVDLDEVAAVLLQPIPTAAPSERIERETGRGSPRDEDISDASFALRELRR